MPPNPVTDAEMPDLVAFLRSIQHRPADDLPRRTFRTSDNRTLEGVVTGEGFTDVQMRTDDGRVHLLRRTGDTVREVTSDRDWPGYNGDPQGNRYTTLTEINKDTVGRLSPSGSSAYRTPATCK